ncbi:MAG: HD domain-containing protein [Fimbriimonadaceae bacterium]
MQTIPIALQQQIEFIVEVDKLKSVLRMTSPIGQARKENSAEHSWQIVLMAMILHEHANLSVDLLKVVKMLAIHDVVEIDVGDTFHYAKTSSPDLAQRELTAAKRIFGILPPEQGQSLLELWQEFEARKTPEAIFAATVDRLVAFLMNRGNDFGTWREHSIAPELILERNSAICDGSNQLWNLAQTIVAEFRASETTSTIPL